MDLLIQLTLVVGDVSVLELLYVNSVTYDACLVHTYYMTLKNQKQESRKIQTSEPSWFFLQFSFLIDFIVYISRVLNFNCYKHSPRPSNHRSMQAACYELK